MGHFPMLAGWLAGFPVGILVESVPSPKAFLCGFLNLSVCNLQSARWLTHSLAMEIHGPPCRGQGVGVGATHNIVERDTKKERRKADESYLRIGIRSKYGRLFCHWVKLAWDMRGQGIQEGITLVPVNVYIQSLWLDLAEQQDQNHRTRTT